MATDRPEVPSGAEAIGFDVAGLPPAKGEARSMFSPRHTHSARVPALLEAATAAVQATAWRTTTRPVHLSVEVRTDRPPRNGLAPGEPTPEREHRVRGLCDGHGSGSCGRCGVAWRRTGRCSPPTPTTGRASRHDTQCARPCSPDGTPSKRSSIVSRPATSRPAKVATECVSATSTPTALITLSFLSMTALALGTLKRRAGVSSGRPQAHDLASVLGTPRGVAA